MYYVSAQVVYERMINVHYYFIFLCGVSVGLQTNSEKPANNTCSRIYIYGERDSEHPFPAPSSKIVVDQCLEFAKIVVL